MSEIWFYRFCPFQLLFLTTEGRCGLLCAMVLDDPAERSISDIRMLGISFAFPPLAYPRSIQVARLVKYLRMSTVVVCADEREARKDPTLEPDAEERLEACLRVPFSVTRSKRHLNALAHRFYRPLWYRWNRAPDEYGSWKDDALNAIEGYARANNYTPDLIVTFSQPVVDHLIGLELKRKYRLPWAAHFSDPWADNPFIRGNQASLEKNLTLEREVVENADRLVFTSQETIDLVMAKYPTAWKSKARVLPQSFDPALYRSGRAPIDNVLKVRYIGNFYGSRTAAPLMRAVEALHSSEPSVLDHVSFELIGITDLEKVQIAPGLPSGLVTAQPPVSYRESLSLMTSADGLMIIDAPADVSVFLPSKLIDYLGARRPILGLTPHGAAAGLIKQLGGWVADPASDAAVRETLKAFLQYLREHKVGTGEQPWGNSDVRQKYEASYLARSFEEIMREMMT